MATYTFRCIGTGRDVISHPDGGHFDLIAPIGTAAAVVSCPLCKGDAVRVFSPPHLSRAHPGALAAIERSEASRTEPAVVTAIPGHPARPPTRRPANPALARLPRP
jgi:hypothetical protein